jgi:serine/threonine protein kinase
MGCGPSTKTYPEKPGKSPGKDRILAGNPGSGGGRFNAAAPKAMKFGPGDDRLLMTSSSSGTPNSISQSQFSIGSSPNTPNRRRTVRENKWKRGELIGAGAFGRVFMGMNEISGELIAIKEMVFTPDNYKEVTALQQEISLMKGFLHPNIVAYLGTEMKGDNTLYIFTEWVPGGSLQSLLKKFGRFTESVILNYTTQILNGCAYLHSNNVVHRDIKGSNILVDDRGNVKLCDFGASKRVAKTMNGATINGDNITLRGTPYFMAPEVITQSGHGSKADVWGVGCTVLQMASGLPPWKSMNFGNISALMYHIANTNEAPPMPDDITPELRSLLNVCFVRDPDQRPRIEELQNHPFIVSAGDTKSWEQTINGGKTVEMLEEMMAKTPSPLKKKRPVGSGSSDAPSAGRPPPPSGDGGVMSDLSLSHNGDDFEEFDIAEFTLPDQTSEDKITNFLTRQATLERSMGSELGTPRSSPRQNPYASGNDRVVAFKASSEYSEEEKGGDVLGELPTEVSGDVGTREEDEMNNSWVESQNRIISTSHAVHDREEWQRHEKKVADKKAEEKRLWEEELERERLAMAEEERKKRERNETIF